MSVKYLPRSSTASTARAREEVAKRLAALDVEALDEDSLTAIAENARNNVYRDAIARVREQRAQ